MAANSSNKPSKSIQKSKMTMKVSAARSNSKRSGLSSSSSSKPSSSSRDTKKRQLSQDQDPETGSEDDQEDQQSADSMDQDDDGEDDEPDTDQEIENSKKVGQSKKTAKRKRRATSPTSFGATLQSLLGIDADSSLQSTGALEAEEGQDQDQDLEDQDSKKVKKIKKSAPAPAPASTAILSLAPHLRRSAASTTLNAKAARLALDQKKKREERFHVTDVIGGWGPPGQLPDEEMEKTRLERLDDEKREFLEKDREAWEQEGGTKGYEKKLRKVAQRGVVKLFNAIRAAQSTTTDDVEAASSELPKTNPLPGGKKQNALGGKESALADLSKSNFLDLIRSGGSGTASKGAKKVIA